MASSQQQQPASSSTRAREARGQEGNRLEEDLIRLSGAEKVAKGKVAFWEQQTGRLGEQVVRTRASLGDQQRLVRKRKEEVEKAQRVLTLCQGELGKQEADLAKMEGQLKVNEEAQRKARADCKVAVEIRATANLKCKAFCEARKERGVASGVTPRGNSESLCRKLDLSQATLAGVLGQVTSDIRDRTVELEGLSLNGATALASEDRLEQEVFEEEEPTARFGAGKEEALGSTGSSASGDWYSLMEVEASKVEGAVAMYQLSISSGDDGQKDTKPVPHQVQEERATPLGFATMEDLQVFHESQWAKIVDCMQLD